MPRHAQQRVSTRPRRSAWAVVIGGIGELLLTAGALVLLFVVYILWGTGIQTARAQDALEDELGTQWEQLAPDAPAPDPDALAEGDAYGILRIPRFGDDWEFTIVQGVQPDDLARGPGHYPNTANPGELGNVGIAAHRSGHAEPFADFPQLRVGDTIEIEMADGTYVYQLDDAPDGDSDGNRIDISDVWVVDPVPGEPRDTEPTEQRITLTTCWPRFGSSHRMYATGTLVSGPSG
ncbi:class E sortase [Jiangella aurantiaca]|uniref:Class E sortase n=1 Tax=Jiangella aurantiaca TaxID=2530373 RepID=A0A4R5A3D7_9ACTN|nr:class E sortase [Jiangella aurantiaca]TDD65194.1 class E sortase [Jiangella aurantiaca]